MKYLDGKRTGKNNWFFKPQVARTSFCVPTRCQSGSHRRRVGENDGTPIFAEVMWTDARQRLVPSRGNHPELRRYRQSGWLRLGGNSGNSASSITGSACFSTSTSLCCAAPVAERTR